jgi:hypothetical protein
MSNTIGFSEIKCYTNQITENADRPALPSLSDIAGLTPSASPNPTFSASGHREWTDGKFHETGFTFVFTPNMKVMVNNGAGMVEGDYLSCKERPSSGPCIGLPNRAAIVTRSYHTGVVQSMLMDGSVRSVSNSIDLNTWRALGTRNGGEITGDF